MVNDSLSDRARNVRLASEKIGSFSRFAFVPLNSPRNTRDGDGPRWGEPPLPIREEEGFGLFEIKARQNYLH
jgi:hypothetical protein